MCESVHMLSHFWSFTSQFCDTVTFGLKSHIVADMFALLRSHSVYRCPNQVWRVSSLIWLIYGHWSNGVHVHLVYDAFSRLIGILSTKLQISLVEVTRFVYVNHRSMYTQWTFNARTYTPITPLHEQREKKIQEELSGLVFQWDWRFCGFYAFHAFRRTSQ